jgi:CRP-like cAMP-binding protein
LNKSGGAHRASTGGNRQAGRQFKLPITNIDIADYVGLTIETVSRTFTRLQAEGLIDIVSQGQIVIRDPVALEQLAGGLPIGSPKLSSENC